VKEVASALKGCSLKAIQRELWQEDKQEIFISPTSHRKAQFLLVIF